MNRHPPKRYCSLCKDVPTEKVGEYTYRCIRCGFVFDESKGQSAYYKQVLVAKPSIITYGNEKKFIIKDADTPSRSEMLTKMNADTSHQRYDRDSMLNPSIKLQPGKIGRTDFWMSAQYASMETDAVTEEKEREFNRLLKSKKYEY
jgi:uncharacterized C2H2 Zn-finger protein